MSHFVANSISISKDFKTFKLKGGDNNCVPRSNYWSNNLAIEELFSCLSSGSADLIAKTEKALFINKLVFEQKNKFGGNWNDETDYYHMRRKEPKPQKVIDFDKKFVKELIEGLKNLSTKKEYVIELKGGASYISRAKRKNCYITANKSDAQKFSKNVAEYHANRFKNYSSKVEKIVKIKEKANEADRKFMKQFFEFSKKDFDAIEIYRRNPFTRQSFEVGPIVAKCIDFVLELEPLINEQKLDLIQVKYPTIKSIGGAIQKFDRARYLILKLDSNVYMNILD